MECNRDEALRAKEIAVSKLENKDYNGARKFALKAQALYPGLEDIQQMLSTIEVYVSSERKINGEMDWYAVLRVDPSADNETIRKQYRKLALVLHPDKNKCVGADGAFKLISEGWTLLNDNVKRSAYNQRRGVFQPRFSSKNAGPSAPAPPRANGFSAPNFAPPVPPPARANGFTNPNAGPSTPAPAKANGSQKSKSEKVSVPKKNQTAPKQPVPKKAPPPKPAQPIPKPVQTSDSFWTVCDKCSTRYEYAKIFLNRTLLCINCKEAFMASEVPRPPKSVLKKTKQTSKKDSGVEIPAKDSAASQPDSNSVKSSNFQKVPVQPVLDKRENVSVGVEVGNSSARTGHPSVGAKQESVGGVGKKRKSGGAKPVNGNSRNTGSSGAVKRENGVQQLFRDSLKRPYKETHSSSGWDEFKKRKQTEDHDHVFSNLSTAARGNANDSGCGDVKDPPGARIYGFSKPYPQPKELTAAETRELLITKAKKEVLNVLREWNTGERKKETRKSTTQGHDQSAKANYYSDKPESSRAKSGSKKDKIKEPKLMVVPDADFYDFDGDRSENSVEENDVWAAYDEKDGMPRTYMSINKVVSRNPFKLKISWLNSKSNPEFSLTNDWTKLGFPKTCGELWVGKYKIHTVLTALSHKVKWSKKPRGSYWIIPQKGDVWALYKNWSADWVAGMPEEVVQKYEMVRVVDDYTEESGVSVAPLVKVVGFKTVFRPNLDTHKIKRIPRGEMFRFSHQVMYHVITDEESSNAPKGCLDIDPAATPLELLQVTIEPDQSNATVSENFDHTGRE